MDNPSRLHVYSFGVVAAVKALSSNIVEVTPVEDQVMADGVISDNATTYTAAGTDAQGQSYQKSIQQTNTVKAEWIPLGMSNRMTSPDVRPGERVMLWRMGDSDKYYWCTFAQDMSLRKLETVVYAWNASPDEADGTDGNSSYFFEVSTHNKLMHLHTSKSNGEVCSFDIQINPGTGVIQMQDDIGQFFMLDAINCILQMQTVDGCVVQLNKKDLTFQVPGTWKANVQNIDWTIGQTNITSGQTTHTGPFTEDGPLQLNGDMTTAAGAAENGGGTGKIQIAGQAELLGSMDVKGPVTATTISATEEITAPNLQYN
jgi:hypothetical protein